MTNTEKTVINITQRELKIMYNIDEMTTYQIADKTGLTDKEVRQFLKLSGIVVKRGETVPEADYVPTLTLDNGTTVTTEGKTYVTTNLREEATTGPGNAYTQQVTNNVLEEEFAN